nr:hypothetical protein Itr_chr08CG17050 [Ipomoea trifida]
MAAGRNGTERNDTSTVRAGHGTNGVWDRKSAGHGTNGVWDRKRGGFRRLENTRSF